MYVAPPLPGLREQDSTVPAHADGTAGAYPDSKRSAELAVEEAFGDRGLVLRPGLILGPGEDVGRLPWWLARAARGGPVLAPGPPELPLQYTDARDLATFALDGFEQDLWGAFNRVSRPGLATMETLLEACRSAAGAPGTELCWLASELVLAAGIEPWTELPVWIPPQHEYAGLHAINVERAHAAALRCRPAAQTVNDTWAWMAATGRAAAVTG